MSPVFSENIDFTDGRYQLVINQLKKKSVDSNSPLNICDAGCGKGRYLNNLMLELPNHNYYAIDISDNVMKNIKGVCDKKVGSLTNIPYKDESFDYVYVCEALEHSLNIDKSIRECLRVLRPEGILLVIDKPIEKLGMMQIEEWERWISDEEMKYIAVKTCTKLHIVPQISYKGRDDGLFRGWIFEKMK